MPFQSQTFPFQRAGAIYLACLFVLAGFTESFAQESSTTKKPLPNQVPRNILLRIIEAEDKRFWNNDLEDLLLNQNSAVRRRAALAAGRIGDERAVAALISLLGKDQDDEVRAMAAFALGEVESAAAGEALIAEISKRDESRIRARAVEALGKIAAALPTTDQAKLASYQKEILNTLEFEAGRRSAPDNEVILLGLTAALRARPEGAGKVIAEFLTYGDPRIRADAANALARLRAKEGNEQLRKLLINDPDPIVRANAARVLGATQGKAAVDALVDRALKDGDSRVRVSAIRALASLNDSQAINSLASRARELTAPGDTNELLEIAAALGRLGQNSKSQATLDWLEQLRHLKAPEVELALARVHPQDYQIRLGESSPGPDWRSMAVVGQGAGELAQVKSGNPVLDASIKGDTIRRLSLRLECFPADANPVTEKIQVKPGMVVGTRCDPLPTKAIPDWLRALGGFKSTGSEGLIRKQLDAEDIVVRATAAELLSELPPNKANEAALIMALKVALKDRELNDATLSTLDALAKQKTIASNEAIKSALNSDDHLVRRRAVALLKTNGAGDFSARIGTVQSRNTIADYQRAISRIGKRVLATVSTTKGPFTIELLPEEAPLTVDSFVRLSQRGYFNNIAFHRVVPNFVIQGGDPRGDGNGGPGYQIRCEINRVPYERGVVGMALSGKDTGGSQWFVTHSPQPHLDGGYTVFGRIVSGMGVVDRITKGDVIRSIKISEAQR